MLAKNYMLLIVALNIQNCLSMNPDSLVSALKEIPAKKKKSLGGVVVAAAVGAVIIKPILFRSGELYFTEYPILESARGNDPERLVSHLNRSYIERRIFGSANVNEKKPNDLDTPLHVATTSRNAFCQDSVRRANNFKVCNLLLKHGADLETLKDDTGKTVFDTIMEATTSPLAQQKEYARNLLFLCHLNQRLTPALYNQAQQKGVDIIQEATNKRLQDLIDS